MSPFHGADKRASYEVYIFDDPTELFPTAPLGQLSVVLNPLTLYIYTTGGYVVVGAGTQAVQTPASESGLGAVELATVAEVEAGTAGVLVASAARLKAELDRRGALAATESTLGPVELATAAETQAGTDATRAVHPAGMKAAMTPEAWITPTLANGWVNYGTPYETTAYYKDRLGHVHLRGALSGGASGTVIFTLPAGYRPAASLAFAGSRISSSSSATRIDVGANGEVFVAQGLGAETHINGISFRV